MGKRVLSRKEQEELKKKEDEEAAAHVGEPASSGTAFSCLIPLSGIPRVRRDFPGDTVHDKQGLGEGRHLRRRFAERGPPGEGEII